MGAPTIFKMHVDFGINLVGERPSKWASSLENYDKTLTQLSSSVSNVRKDLVRENFHARLVLFIS